MTVHKNTIVICLTNASDIAKGFPNEESREHRFKDSCRPGEPGLSCRCVVIVMDEDATATAALTVMAARENRWSILCPARREGVQMDVNCGSNVI